MLGPIRSMTPPLTNRAFRHTTREWMKQDPRHEKVGFELLRRYAETRPDVSLGARIDLRGVKSLPQGLSTLARRVGPLKAYVDPTFCAPEQKNVVRFVPVPRPCRSQGPLDMITNLPAKVLLKRSPPSEPKERTYNIITLQPQPTLKRSRPLVREPGSYNIITHLPIQTGRSQAVTPQGASA